VPTFAANMIKSDGVSLADEVWGNNGTVSRALFQATERGRALAFAADGPHPHDTVLLDASKGLKFAGGDESFTVCVNVLFRSFATYQSIMWIQDANDDMWRFVVWNDQTVRASLNTYDFQSTSTLSANIWYHLAAVFDKNGAGQIYIDGKANGTPVNLNNDVLDLTTDDLWIGVVDATQFQADMKLEGLAIFPCALSPGQVATHAISTRNGGPGLIGQTLDPRYMVIAGAAEEEVDPHADIFSGMLGITL